MQKNRAFKIFYFLVCFISICFFSENEFLKVPVSTPTSLWVGKGTKGKLEIIQNVLFTLGLNFMQ